LSLCTPTQHHNKEKEERKKEIEDERNDFKHYFTEIKSFAICKTISTKWEDQALDWGKVLWKDTSIEGSEQPH
jgi:hypothetical protein